MLHLLFDSAHNIFFINVLFFPNGGVYLQSKSLSYLTNGKGELNKNYNGTEIRWNGDV